MKFSCTFTPGAQDTETGYYWPFFILFCQSKVITLITQDMLPFVTFQLITTFNVFLLIAFFYSFLDLESFQTTGSEGDCNISSITGEQSFLAQSSNIDKDKSQINDDRNNWSVLSSIPDVSSLPNVSTSFKDSCSNEWFNQSTSLFPRDDDRASQDHSVQTFEDLSSYFDKV